MAPQACMDGASGDRRLAERCPYGLGASCPIVAITERAVSAHQRALVVTAAAAAVVGVVIAVFAVRVVYYGYGGWI